MAWNRHERELRSAIGDLLSDSRFRALTPTRRASLAAEFVAQWAADQPAEEPNKGKPWTDESLRVVLQQAPTHANIVRRWLARSGEALVRWSRSTGGPPLRTRT